MIPEWNSFINADCMEYLKEFPDNYFDLAIVDPPYGDAMQCDRGGWNRFGERFNRYFHEQEAPGRVNTGKKLFRGM